MWGSSLQWLCLNERLKAVLEKYLVPQQGCGRVGHGSLEQAMYFKKIVSQAIARVKQSQGVEGAEAVEPMYVCFTDALKAYDRVWRGGLYMALFYYGVRGKLLEMVMLWLDRARAETVWNGTKGPEVKLEQGLRQGCAMSPLLYCIFLNVFVGKAPRLGGGG